ncbi:unnamed protein product [Onchocerca ochengi]|uniref:C3H1-type domain-containing protein n=1 Tax=Onchocerca ochengi TaxID=42157 RepID=A0A182ELR4_ONCOC|nr:unnamed protein product [Onchocerca ochengi]
MSNLHENNQANDITADGIIFYPKLGCMSTTTPTTTLTRSAASVDQKRYENNNLKLDEESLEQKMAALTLETRQKLLNEIMLRKVQMQNSPLAYPTGIHFRTPRAGSQRNRELYKTALCDFWSNGMPCRYGERCWFAHGPHELRIARFVYPGLHPYDYEIHMNSPKMLSSPYGQRFWNLEQNNPAPSAQSTPTMNPQPQPTPITPMGQNVPIGYERKLRRISPIHENVNQSNGLATQRGVSSGDSSVGSTSTTNSPEMIAKYIGWWPDTINNAYSFINRPYQNIQPNYNAAELTNEQCCSRCTEPTIDKFQA